MSHADAFLTSRGRLKLARYGTPAQLVGTLPLVGLALHFIWRLVAGAVVVGGVWSKSGRSTPLAMLSPLCRPEPPR